MYAAISKILRKRAKKYRGTNYKSEHSNKARFGNEKKNQKLFCFIFNYVHFCVHFTFKQFNYWVSVVTIYKETNY